MKPKNLSAALVATAALICVAVVCPASVRAQAVPPNAARDVPPVVPRILLTVHTLRDAGGLPTEGGDKNLHEQFADGLRKYLGGISPKRFDVNPGAKEATPPPANVRAWSVDGEMSRTDDGNNKPFMVVVRLYQEKTGSVPRRVVAQWAGVADNYRYLTGNLDNRADVDREGLLGEMGKRIASVVSAVPRNAAFDAFANAAQSRRVLVTLVPVRGAGENGDGAAPTAVIAAPQLEAEQGYRIKVASQDAGTVVVLTRDGANGAISLLAGQNAPPSVAPGKPLLVPASGEKPWSAPAANAPGEQTLFVFVRHEKPAATFPAGENRVLGATTNGVPPVSPTPVRVLSTSTLGGEATSSVLENLLQTFAADPKGTWTAQRLVVKIVPATAK